MAYCLHPLFDLAQSQPDVVIEQPPLLGQVDIPSPLFKQIDSQFVLQPGDHPAQR